MVTRRSRRAQKKPPEVVPPKSDEEQPDAEAGDDNTGESDEESDDKTNTTETSSRPRRRQKGRKPRGSGESENEDNSSDEGKSKENTDSGASSDDEPLSAKANAKRTRQQKKPAETDGEGKKTPNRRGRQRKNVEEESNAEDGSDAEKETIRKSRRRNAGRRKQQDPSSASEDGSAKKRTRRRGRPKKSQDAEDSDSKMETAEEDGGSSEEESTNKPTRRRGRLRKNQDTEDDNSKMESAEEESAIAEESTKKTARRRGRRRKNQDTEDDDSKVESAEDDGGSSEGGSTKKITRRRGRLRKNQETEDSDSKIETAEEDVGTSEEESTKKPARRRGRPTKTEDTDSKMETAEEGGGSSEDESTKRPRPRRGQQKKKQDVEESDSKMESTEGGGGSSEDESTKKPRRRRGQQKKNKDVEESDSKVGAAEEDGGSSDVENKRKPTGNDEATSRPARRRGRTRKSSESTSSNDEGEEETQPKDAENKASKLDTAADPVSNDVQTRDKEAQPKSGRPGRPQSGSAHEKGSSEAREPSSRKRGRTPPVPSSDDEPNGSNQPTRVSKRRLERVDETFAAATDSATPSDEKNANEDSAETSSEKPTTQEEASTEAAAKDKNEDGGSSSKPEPKQEKQEATSTEAAAMDKNGGGPSSRPEPKQEKQQTENDSTTETSTRRPKRLRGSTEQPAETAATKIIYDAEKNEKEDKDCELETQGKKRSRTDVNESTNNARDSAGDSVAKQVEPISTKAEANSSPKTAEEKDSEKEKSESSKSTQDHNDVDPGTKVRVTEAKDPSEAATRSDIPDASEKKTFPEGEKTEVIVPTASSGSKDIGDDKKADLSTKMGPLVTKPLPTKVNPLVTKPLPTKANPLVTDPTARPSSESYEVVSHGNASSEKKAQKSDQSECQVSVEHNQSKAIADNDGPTLSLEPPTTKMEANDSPKVQPSSPVSASVQPSTSDDKKPTAGFSDPAMTPSEKTDKSENQNGNRASDDMDVDSPVKDVTMAGVKKKTPTPGMAVAVETSHAKESQPKPSEIAPSIPRPKAVQTVVPGEKEEEKRSSCDAELPVIASAAKSMSNETMVIPTDTSTPREESNAGATDSNEPVASDNISECVDSSPVTESSSEDDDESDGEDDRPEPRFETKAMPFTSSTLLPNANKQQNSLELLGNKVDRVKTMLYTIGSRVHRGHGFERIFAKYWDALTMRLSDRLSSYASRQCNAAVKAFLKSPKLRRIHNKLVVTLMKTSMKSFAPLNEISDHIPEVWYGKVKQVDRVLVEDGVKETKRQRKAREKRSARKQTTVYREAWASTQGTEENSTSAIYLKTRSQEVDMRKIYASSATIPGALVIDPLVRDIAEQSNMRASENAIWLLIIAAREHTSNVLKNALQHKADMECGEVSEPFLQYPNVIAGTKIAPKKDTPAETTKQQPTAPVDFRPGKSQKRKVVTSFDIYSSSLAVPAGPPASLGGSVSTTALELGLQNAYTSSTSCPGTDFSDVQKHIVERITSLAQDRKAMLLARGEEAKSNQMNLVTSQQQAVNNGQNVVSNNSVVSNPQVGVGATSAVGTPAVSLNAPARGQARQYQNSIPTTKPKPALAVQMQQGKIETIPSSTPTNVAAASLNTPAIAREAKPVATIPGRLGRGAKDLAALIKRSSAEPAPAPTAAPVSNDKVRVATESTTVPPANPHTQKPAEGSGTDELGTSTGSGRRGLGFGRKNLSAMISRTPKPGDDNNAPKPGEDKAAQATVVLKEQQKQIPKTGTRPTGAKDLRAIRGAAGSKDLAALKARSEARVSSEAVKTTEETEQKKEAGPQGAAIDPKSAQKVPETSTEADTPIAASVPPKPSNSTQNKADSSIAPRPANAAKTDSTKAPSPADNKNAGAPDSNDTNSRDRDTKGGESDDSSVVVIESVKPAPKAGNKDAFSSSEGNKTVASIGQPNGHKVEVKDANAPRNTQPRPVIAPEKPEESKSAKESLVEKESKVAKDAPVTSEAKATSEAKGDAVGGQSTASPPTAATTTVPAALADAATPKTGESDPASASKSDENKPMKGSTVKPDGTKADETARAKAQEIKVDSSNASAKTDEKAEHSK